MSNEIQNSISLLCEKWDSLIEELIKVDIEVAKLNEQVERMEDERCKRNDKCRT